MDQAGNGYSLWYVPGNFQKLQLLYNVQHIPHVSLHRNLTLKDACQMYQCISSSAKMRVRDVVTHIPSSSLISPSSSCINGLLGWYVDVDDGDTIFQSYVQICGTLTMDIDPPKEEMECSLYIVDTQSLDSRDWTIDKNYFNIKTSQIINVVTFDNTNRKTYKITSTVDEYFGTTVKKVNKTKQDVKETLKARGFVISEGDLTILMHNIKSDLVTSD
jgi:hypothetical protein